MFEKRWAWAAFILLMLAPPAVWTWWRSAPDLPHLAPAPGFVLVDQAGAERSTLELRGRVTVINFIFTRCPDVCPLLSSKMAWLQRQLPDQPLAGAEIRLWSLTVDPAYDTPAVLAEYGARYDADPARWSFLTGPPDTVSDVIAGFQQMADRTGDPDDPIPNIAHSERFLLVDADAVIRGFYRSDDEGMRQLRADTVRLARSGGR